MSTKTAQKPAKPTPQKRPRSCLKHTAHPNYDDDREGGNRDGHPTSPTLLSIQVSERPAKIAKSVSFDGHEPLEVHYADADYDRCSVPMAGKLSYEDILELKMLKIHLMCPRNSKSCNLIPLGILPLLPPADPKPPSANPSLTASTALTENAKTTSTFPKQAPPQIIHLGDETWCSSIPTPPPSSPSYSDSSEQSSPTEEYPPNRRSLSERTQPLMFRSSNTFKRSNSRSPVRQDRSNNSSSSSSSTVLVSPKREAPTSNEKDLPYDYFPFKPPVSLYTPPTSSAPSPAMTSSSAETSDHDDDDDDNGIPAFPFAPPKCQYIQPTAAAPSIVLSQSKAAQRASSPPPSRPPMFPFMPLLPQH